MARRSENPWAGSSLILIAVSQRTLEHIDKADISGAGTSVREVNRYIFLLGHITGPFVCR